MKEHKSPHEAVRIGCEVFCAVCKFGVQGWLALDSGLTVCDSGGFLLAGGVGPNAGPVEPVCDACCERLFGRDPAALVRSPSEAQALAGWCAKALSGRTGKRGGVKP